MFRTMLKSTIHRATVTLADPPPVGSVTVDPVLMDAADLLPGEQVTVVDLTNGARLEAPVVAGERSSGVLGVSGAAAGDTVVLFSYGQMDSAQAAVFAPRVVLVDECNRIVEADTEPAPVAEPVGETAETADAAMLDALLQQES
jgi:aspartate 1-decarboxylase